MTLLLKETTNHLFPLQGPVVCSIRNWHLIVVQFALFLFFFVFWTDFQDHNPRPSTCATHRQGVPLNYHYPKNRLILQRRHLTQLTVNRHSKVAVSSSWNKNKSASLITSRKAMERYRSDEGNLGHWDAGDNEVGEDKVFGGGWATWSRWHSLWVARIKVPNPECWALAASATQGTSSCKCLSVYVFPSSSHKMANNQASLPTTVLCHFPLSSVISFQNDLDFTTITYRALYIL